MKELKVGLVFKKRVRLMTGAVLLLMMGSFFYSNNTSADYVGPGNNTSGVTTDCSSFVNGYQYLCGKPSGSGGGGASWHIYEASRLSLKKLHYVGSILDYGGIDANDVKSSCAKAGWVAVYGWEGSVNKGNGNILTGPAKRTGDIRDAQYNPYNTMNWNTLQNRILNNNIPDNRRITLDAAKKLYSSYNNGKTLDDNVGYFCFGPKRFKAQASVYKGDKVSNEVPRSTTGYVDQKKEAKTLQIECADEKNGCKVHFSLNLAQVGASGGRTWYRIFTKKIGDSTLTKVTDQKYTIAKSSGERVFEKTVSLKPGENICYAVYFNYNSLLPNNSTWARVCAKSVKPSNPPQSELRFEGQARVYEGEKVDANKPKSTTGYTDKSEVRAKTLDLNCPMSGCKVHFSLDLRKKSGTDQSKDWYIFYRKDTSNSAGTQELCRGEVWFNSSSQGTNNCGDKVKFDIDGGQRRFGFDEDLKPGQVVCYTNKFGTIGGSSKETGGYYGWAKVCVRALSSVEPLLSIQVRNIDLNTEYSDYVYAKPGDEVSYRSIYNPLTQSAQNWRPGGMRVYVGSNVFTDEECDDSIDGSCGEANDDGGSEGGDYASDDGESVGGTECDENVEGGCEEIEGSDELIDNDDNMFVSDEAAFEEDPNDYGGEDYAGGDLIEYDGVDLDNVAYISVKNSEVKDLKTLFNSEVKEILPEWNNAYVVRGISSENCASPYVSETYRYEVGDAAEKVESDKNITKVLGADVGCSLGKMAEINPNSRIGNIDANIWTTPSRVEANVGDTNETSTADVYTERIFDTAKVLIPYNFINTVDENSVKLSENVMYAGEDNIVSYIVKTGLKPNGELNDKYATIVRGAKWRAEACYNMNGKEECVSGKEESGDLHRTEGIYQEAESLKESIVSVPDVPAGTKIQMRACVYPSNSGDDRNWEDPRGSNQWECSSKEFTVAKKPSFQVWGGEIYSAGGVNTSLAKKTALAGYSLGIKESGAKESRTFGSWGELAVVSNGKISGLASGAGLGYAGRDGNTLWPNPTFAGGTSNKTSDYQGGGNNDNINDRDSGGGVDINSFCSVSTLTFPNGGCNSSSSSGGSGSGSFDFSMDDFISKNAETVQLVKLTGSSIDGIANFQSWDDDGDGNPDGKHTTVVYQSDSDDIEISGDITYSDAKYEKLQDVPKIIIYAKKNININCGVSRIDAILIAEDGNINTCSDSGDDNLKVRSNQLVVNGVTASQTLTLNRTYGAATGANSIIPAEIVNYDSSLYLWGKSQSSSDETIGTGRIKAAYIQELSPRY